MRRLPALDALRDSPDACVCTVLRKAGRASTQMYDRDLAPANLTTAQFSILTALYYASPIPMKKLAQRLLMDRTTLTRNLRPLERAGLLRLADDDTDARVKNVHITSGGLKALEIALPYWQAAQSRMLDGLGETTWRQLRASLRRSIEVSTSRPRDGIAIQGRSSRRASKTKSSRS